MMHGGPSHSRAALPVLGELPVQRGEAGALGLPRASLHGHRHPQRTAALRHLPAAQVASARPLYTRGYKPATT